MEAKKAGLDVFNFIKSSFDSTLESATKVQDQGEKVLKDMVEKGKEFQADAENVLNDALTNVKKARDEYKKIVEEGFKKVEDLFKS